MEALREHLDSHDNSRKEVQEKLHNICKKWRKEIDDLENKINNELEAKFKEEDSRLQATMSNLQSTISTGVAKTEEALQKAKAELLVVQKYNLSERRTKIEKDSESDGCDGEDDSYEESDEEKRSVPVELSERLELETVKEIAPERFDCFKPRDLKVNKVSNAGRVFLSFTINIEQERVLKEKKDLRTSSLTKLCCRRKAKMVKRSTASKRRKLLFICTIFP